MRNLFRFFQKNITFFLFLILELFCLGLVVRFNNYQKVKFLNSSNQLTAGIFDGFTNITEYLTLRKTNQLLAEENSKLRTILNLKRQTTEDIGYLYFADSIMSNCHFSTAKVINNSVNKQHNYIVLDKGSNDGVEIDMGVVAASGVVGRINSVTKHYSTAISLLNNRWSISAKLKRTNDNGMVIWDGRNHRKVLLESIPYNVKLNQGDTVVTSGYSSVFPDNIPIGTVSKIDLDKGSNFYIIELDLFIDFNQLTFVNIVKNKYQDELNGLNKQLEDD